MRLFIALAASLALAAGGAAAVHAAPAQSKMQACAAQWNQLKAANKTGGQTYKTFSSACMKGNAATPAVKPAPAKVTPAKVAATKVAASKPQDRMKQCAAQWNQLKAANKTGGQTYKQFSASCLKKA
ncbi:MAG TPA: hypothetical protein VF402_00485 [Asticcacaulis sp.]